MKYVEKDQNINVQYKLFIIIIIDYYYYLA